MGLAPLTWFLLQSDRGQPALGWAWLRGHPTPPVSAPGQPSQVRLGAEVGRGGLGTPGVPGHHVKPRGTCSFQRAAPRPPGPDKFWEHRR